MEGPIQTNIVASSESVELDRVEYSKRLAQDAINLLEEEFQKDLTPEFWTLIFSHAKREVDKYVPAPDPPISEPSPPPTVSDSPDSKPIPVLTKEQKDKLLKEDLPWGKYVGMKVGTVLKKDKESLRKMAFNPLPFQLRLQKLFLSATENPDPQKSS